MIVENFQNLINTIPSYVKVVVVTKFQPNEKILSIYNLGYKIFGENRVQELVQKFNTLPKDIEWHLIGHLQTNKVKYIVPFVSLIHSVDSIKLLETINKEAIKSDRIIQCLLQVHIAKEETKFGFNSEEILDCLNNYDNNKYSNIIIKGLMGMATFTDDENQIRNEFRNLKILFDKIKVDYKNILTHFDTLSMGMTNDYKIAIEEGSNMIRIGSLIFGSREY